MLTRTFIVVICIFFGHILLMLTFLNRHIFVANGYYPHLIRDFPQENLEETSQKMKLGTNTKYKKINNYLPDQTLKEKKNSNTAMTQPNSALFDYNSLLQDGMENPIFFGAEHIKARLDREIKYGEDISTFKDVESKDPPGFDKVNAAAIETTKGNDVPFRVGDKIPSTNARQILIATTWRSGSSFTGDIIRTFPGTFYSFEPLHYTYRKEINLEKYGPAIDLLKSLFKCKYDSEGVGYFNHASLAGKQFLVDDNSRVWQVCRKLLPSKAACFMPEFYEAVCPLFPIQLIKTVRLRVEYAAKLLEDPELINLKVIVLIRDPRGTMNSRSTMRWCFRDECSNVTRICDDLNRDITSAYNLRDRYPGRIYLVRYEDLSLNPYERVNKILQFLELPQNSGVENFIKTHTKTDRDPKESQSEEKKSQAFVDPNGTYRDSKKTPFAWRHQMDLETIHRIQEKCKVPMEKGGYKLIKTKEEKDDPDFLIITKTTKDIWPWEK